MKLIKYPNINIESVKNESNSDREEIDINVKREISTEEEFEMKEEQDNFNSNMDKIENNFNKQNSDCDEDFNNEEINVRNNEDKSRKKSIKVKKRNITESKKGKLLNYDKSIARKKAEIKNKSKKLRNKIDKVNNMDNNEMFVVKYLTKEEVLMEVEEGRNIFRGSDFLYKCNDCLLGFNSEVDLQEHNEIRHNVVSMILCAVYNHPQWW